MEKTQVCRIWILLFFFFSTSYEVSSQEIIKENLGNNINTSYDETKPVISPDGKILYFARQDYPDNYKGIKDPQDIYYSLLSNYEWSKSINIGEPLNDKYPNGVSSVSSDGNSILVINSYNGYTVGNGASISHKNAEGWSYPQSIIINNFYNLSQFVDYTISSNEKTLLLAIQTDDSHGDQDIYVSFKENENEWSQPVNLGSNINTDKAEFSPFLAADNKTLFFASTGHNGLGESDIFYSKRLDDTWQNWSDPVNLGPVINSEGFEAYYTIPASGEFAYYVSDKNSMEGSRDIFKATIPYEFRPEPVILIAGKVFDQRTREPLETVVIFNSETDVTADYGLTVSNNETGEYTIILPRGQSYYFMAHREGYFPVPLFKDATNLTEYEEINGDLSLVPIEEGQTINLFNIFFENNSAHFNPESYVELDRLTAVLIQYPNLEIEVGAHTSQLPMATDNLKLSEERALEVIKYFDKKQVDVRRLIAQGYGNMYPLNPNAFKNLKAGTDVNERIDFKIISTTWAPPSDIDKDGIPDESDSCPELGPEEGKGCPDSDGDGVYDADDKCPKTAGLADLEGCPEIEKEVEEVLKEALEGIEFESGKNVILKRSYIILDKVVDVMNAHPEYLLRISGHTDNVGNPDNNLLLSHHRAQAALQYLVDHGIDVSRLEAIGYGDQKPVADNKTKSGRAKNRRVEFEVLFE